LCFDLISAERSDCSRGGNKKDVGGRVWKTIKREAKENQSLQPEKDRTSGGKWSRAVQLRKGGERGTGGQWRNKWKRLAIQWDGQAKLEGEYKTNVGTDPLRGGHPSLSLQLKRRPWGVFFNGHKERGRNHREWTRYKTKGRGIFPLGIKKRGKNGIDGGD